jgi:transcriptional regulator with XRE-family HTH domain
MMKNGTFQQPTSQSVAKRIRALRKGRGWTLHEVEIRTSGSIKAVVMGSYERGSRALSLTRTIEIADLFGIPIASLLGDFSRTDATSAGALTIDQRRLAELTANNNDERVPVINSYISAIAARRGDWNGEVLTLRATDFDTLTLVFQISLPDLKDWLSEKQLLLITLK